MADAAVLRLGVLHVPFLMLSCLLVRRNNETQVWSSGDACLSHGALLVAVYVNEVCADAVVT